MFVTNILAISVILADKPSGKMLVQMIFALHVGPGRNPWHGSFSYVRFAIFYFVIHHLTLQLTKLRWFLGPLSQRAYNIDIG